MQLAIRKFPPEIAANKAAGTVRQRGKFLLRNLLICQQVRRPPFSTPKWRNLGTRTFDLRCILQVATRQLPGRYPETPKREILDGANFPWSGKFAPFDLGSKIRRMVAYLGIDVTFSGKENFLLSRRKSGITPGSQIRETSIFPQETLRHPCTQEIFSRFEQEHFLLVQSS